MKADKKSPAPPHDREDHALAKIALGAVFVLFSYVIYRAAAAFAWDGRWFLWSFTLLSVFFTIISLASFRSSHRLVRRGFWIAAYWSGWLGVFFGAAMLFDVLENISLMSGGAVLPAAAGFISLAVAIVIIAYGTWQSTHITVSNFALALSDLPAAWQGKTVVFVSDLHLGNVHDERFARKVVDRVNTLAPEIVLIGGDVYDGVAGRENELVAPLRGLRAPRGVYFVTGNHEYISHEIWKCLDALKNVGVHILENETVNLDGLTVVGVDYHDVEHPGDFDAVLRGMALAGAQPSILLKHVPEHFDVAARHGVSLVLSGHTHNGQIWPMNYCGALFKTFYYGHHHLSGTQILVSSGVGTQGAPFRLGTKSEIVAMTLARK